MIDRELLQKLYESGADKDLLLQMILKDEPTPAAGKAASPDNPTPKTSNEAPADPASPSGASPVGGEDPAKEKPALTLEIDPILSAIQELTGTIRASNIINRSRDYQPPESVDEAADKALAQILSGRK